VSFLIASGHVEVDARTERAKAAITGIIGALGAVGPAAAVAGAGLASAGVGIAAFGLAAGKQIGDLKKASDAQSKYQEAVAKSGKGSQEAAKAEVAYQQTLSKMPKATKEATAAFSALKDSYKGWSDSLAGDTMPVFTKSFQLFSALLPKTTGLVQGTSRELDRMVTLIAGGVNSPGFDAFMGKLTSFSTATLHALTNGVINLSRSLSGFAAGGGFDGFMSNVEQAGPLIGETLANLAKALLHLATAGGDMGISLLKAANALAQLVNAIPTGVLSTFLQLYAAMKLLSIGMGMVGAVAASTAMQRLGTFFAATWAGGFRSAVSGVVQRMSMLQKATVGLGAIAVVAVGIDKLAEKARGAPPDVDRLTTSLKKLATTGRFTGELAKSFGNIQGMVDDLRKLRKAQQEIADQQDSGSGFFDMKNRSNPVGDWVWGIVDDFKKGEDSAKSLEDKFKSLDKSLAQLATSGHAKEAAQSFADIRKALRADGMSNAAINKTFAEYKAAVADLKAEQALSAQGMGLFGQQAIATGEKLAAQKASADGLRQSIQALNDVNRQGLGGMIGFEAALDAASKAASENGRVLSMSHGKLNLNSEKARTAATALNDLAQKTDEAAASARESGASWETVNGVYSRGRSQLVASAMQMGLTKAQAEQLASSILKIPDSKKTKVQMQREDAIAGLNAVIAKMKATPGSKSVTVKTLSKSAIDALEAVGFKVKRLPDGSLTVSAKTGTAQSNIGRVQSARDRLSGKSITITATYRTVFQTVGSAPSQTANLLRQQASRFGKARGGQVPRYAAGGDVQMFPAGGYVDGPGTPTSDSILALMGSGAAARISRTEYVVRSAAVAKYGVPFLDALNTGRLKLPGFAKGGKLSAKQKAAQERAKQKAAAEKQRQKEGKSALTSDTTFTTAGRLAGYKYTETVHDLGMPDSVGSLVTSINSYLNNIKKAFTGATEKRLVAQLTSSGKALLANQKKLEDVNKRLEAAKGTLDDLKGKFDSLKTSISSSLVSFGNITKIGKYGTSADTLIKQLQTDTTRTTEFSSMLAQLKSKGLNATAIGDIAQAGVTGGGMATAQSLLAASPEQIKRINELQGQLQKSADAAGATAATAMYGAGMAAAQGLVAGLTAQQNAIENAMKKIALSMEKAIKKALGIKSPSKVMEQVGDYSMQGVEQGWVKRAAAGNTMITGGPTLRATPSLISAGSAAASSGLAINNLTVHVSGSFDFASPAERRAAAKALVKDINDELRVYQRQRS
jgi:hypothetical protein